MSGQCGWSIPPLNCWQIILFIEHHPFPNLLKCWCCSHKLRRHWRKYVPHQQNSASFERGAINFKYINIARVNMDLGQAVAKEVACAKIQGTCMLVEGCFSSWCRHYASLKRKKKKRQKKDKKMWFCLCRLEHLSTKSPFLGYTSSGAVSQRTLETGTNKFNRRNKVSTDFKATTAAQPYCLQASRSTSTILSMQDAPVYECAMP